MFKVNFERTTKKESSKLWLKKDRKEILINDCPFSIFCF